MRASGTKNYILKPVYIKRVCENFMFFQKNIGVFVEKRKGKG